jgi:hypothetical protein
MIPYQPELAKALLAAGGSKVYGGKTAPTTLRAMLDALLVAQIGYWIGKTANHHDGHRWVYNSWDEWGSQLGGFSRDDVRASVDRLSELGVLVAINSPRVNIDRRKWLRIDSDVLKTLTPSGKLPLSSDAPSGKLPLSTVEAFPIEGESFPDGEWKLPLSNGKASTVSTVELPGAEHRGLAQETYSGNACAPVKGSSSDSNGSQPKVRRDGFAALRAKVAEENG